MPCSAYPWYAEHHFIYIGFGVMVTRADPGGIQFERPDDGQEWYLVEKPSSSSEETRIIKECKNYAEGGKYTEYDTLNNNCEGFCHMIYHGVNYSAQVARG